MAKKVILKDLDDNKILPITRGELVLDSSGNQAFHSNEFLATLSLPGLMSAEDKYKIINMLASSLANALTLKINNGSVEGTNLYTYNGSATKTLDIKNGTGIGFTNTAGVLSIYNSGVRSISTGTANGTISVNTNGTSANVAVKGLGSAAYTNTNLYQKQAQFNSPSSDTLAYKKVTIVKSNLDGFGIWIHSRLQHYLINSGVTAGTSYYQKFYELNTAYNSVDISTNRIINVKTIATYSSSTITLYIASSGYNYVQIVSAGDITISDSTKTEFDSITSSTTGWIPCTTAKWTDTTYNVVSNSANGLAPKVINTNTATVGSAYYVLASTNGSTTPSWYKLPANAFANDDTKVTQTNTTTSASYRVLLSGNANDTTETTTARKSANLTFNPNTGTLNTPISNITNQLVIANTGNAKHILFSRGKDTDYQYNYIAAPEGGYICILPNGVTNSSTSGMQFTDKGLRPATNAAYSLGTTSLKWNNVYANTFIGNLDGTYVNTLTGYTKATAISALATTDTLNTALGKLEYKADVAYDLVKGAYDGDETIENLAEILKVLEGIKDTETILAIVGKYLPLSGGTINSTSQVPLLLNSSHDGGTTRIAFINKNTPWGYLGFNGLNSPCFISAEGATYPLIHSGNIGSQSVNYATSADKLGEYSESAFFRYRGSADAANVNCDDVEGFGMYYVGDVDVSSTGYPTNNGNMLNFRAQTGLFQILSNYSGDAVWIRSRWYNNKTAWRRIAYTSSNVASATTANYVKSFLSDTTQTSRDANSPTQPIMRHYGSLGASISNMPTGWTYGSVLTIETEQNSALNSNLNLQLAWDVRHDVNNVAGYLWMRTKDKIRGYRSWERLALMSDLNNYLPLSGGTISNTTSTPLTLNRSTANLEVGLRLTIADTSKAWIGYTPGTGTYLYTYTSPAHKLGITDAGIGFIDSNTILHTGNISSYITATAGSNVNSVGTPSVTASTSNGVTTFTFNNLKGEKGEKGNNGTSCTHSWSGTTLSVTSASGTSSANLKGATGNSVKDLVCVTASEGTTTGSASTADSGISYYRIKDSAGNWLTGTIAVKNGSKGTAGTSVTISSIVLNNSAGGTSTVTFSDNKTLSIKNGSNGTNATTTAVTSSTANGLAPKVISSNTDTVGSAYYVLASSNGSTAPSWYKLPASAFSGLGYVGTTKVLSTSAAQALTGIKTITGSTETLYISSSSTAHPIYFRLGTSNKFAIGSNVVPFTDIIPGSTNTVNLGNSTISFKNIYAAGGNFYVTASGAFWKSDRRFKDNIKSPVKNGMLDDETGLIRKFNWKDTGKASCGFIAQELLPYVPEAVDYNAELNKYSVNYDVAHSALIAQLVIKLKELESEVIKLKQLIN